MDMWAVNNLQKRVLKSTYKPNCYILVSGARRDIKETAGQFMVVATVSFLYDAGDIATEWEPEYGPIQIWDRCLENDKDAREHYYFDYTNSPPLHCSYLAVEDNRLPQALHRGDFDYIYEVLKKWADR